MKLVPDDLKHWIEHARRDDWYDYFFGSDIRCMLAEIERLRMECSSLQDEISTWVDLYGPPAPAYVVAYDPELDLWAIMDKDGYVVDHEVFKWRAVILVRKLNAKEKANDD